jgi:hypothetical protein
MKKTYFVSPAIALPSFFGFIFAEMIFNHLPFSPFSWSQHQIYGTVVLAIVLFWVAWLGLIIKITDKTITRYLFLIFSRTHDLSEVVSVEDKVDSDTLGKLSFTEVRFKNGDKWNLLMFSSKNFKEIKDILTRNAKESAS